MRNFILFIRRFSNLLLFLLLEVICIVLIGRTNTMQGNDIMSSANYTLASMYEQRDDMAYYFALRRMNDSLMNENLRLRQQLTAYRQVDTLTDSTGKVVTYNKDSQRVVKYADYVYHSAKVINNTVGAVNNFITINRGEADGVKKDMAVVSASGAVGRIIHTSKHYASAISILSKKQQVSARLKDGTVGHVIWKGQRPDELTMRDVPEQIKVKKGDSVFTTEFSFFPPDVLIGVIYKIETVKSKNLKILHLRTATNFRRIQYVYVVENKMAEERLQLEAQNK
ncbi:MAG: rod shape-determining protein MreC [Chitinophagales bacterium]|nr:rod shape-determining protein MreC [Chitinophagaceae bacterium]MCB9063955.1 rod shape-determining protein MreC [Chitinophagales bacterium]